MDDIEERDKIMRDVFARLAGTCSQAGYYLENTAHNMMRGAGTLGRMADDPDVVAIALRGFGLQLRLLSRVITMAQKVARCEHYVQPKDGCPLCGAAPAADRALRSSS